MSLRTAMGVQQERYVFDSLPVDEAFIETNTSTYFKPLLNSGTKLKTFNYAATFSISYLNKLTNPTYYGEFQLSGNIVTSPMYQHIGVLFGYPNLRQDQLNYPHNVYTPPYSRDAHSIRFGPGAGVGSLHSWDTEYYNISGRYNITHTSRLMIAVDNENNQYWVGVDGLWHGNPSTGTLGYSLPPDATLYPFVGAYSNGYVGYIDIIAPLNNIYPNPWA